MITIIVARSKKRKLPNGLKPIPIISVDQMGNVVIYILSAEHDNHTDTEISELSFHNINSLESFLENLGVDAANLEKLHQIHYPRLHNRETGEHIIFCFHESVQLSREEELKFGKSILNKIAPDSSAVWAFHRNKSDGRNSHMHAAVSNFHKSQFWRLRIRELRSSDSRKDYLAYVNKCAREAVEGLNHDREKEDRDPIPTLVDIRMAKQKEKEAGEAIEEIGKDFTNLMEALAQQVGYWLPEGDEEETRKRIRKAIDSAEVPWKLTSEGAKCIKATPSFDNKTKEYTFPILCIKVSIRKLYLEHSREPSEEDSIIEQLTKRIGPKLYGSKNQTSQPDGLALRDALLEFGYEARATSQIIEARAPDGTLFRVRAEKLRDLVYERTLKQVETTTRAIASMPPLTRYAKTIAEETISPEMIDAPRAKRLQLTEKYIYANGLQLEESCEGLHQLYRPGNHHHWQWISLDRVYEELQQREQEDLERKNKEKQEAIRKADALSEFQRRMDLLARSLKDPTVQQMCDKANQHGLRPTVADGMFKLQAEINGIACYHQFELPEGMEYGVLPRTAENEYLQRDVFPIDSTLRKPRDCEGGKEI